MKESTTPSMPKGIPYIIGNEAAERFSYYGMKTILTVYMTEHLMNSSGELDVMSEGESKVWFHFFAMGIYFFPIIGAVISDVFWGKYKTIISLSIVYCLGHIALSLDETRLGLGIGLTLIAIGSGGIKPCVSANVGDQFTEENKSLIERVFNYFYLAINFGALLSSLLTPILLKNFGPSVAFGVPGGLMILATIIFWLGKKQYRVIPPVGIKKYAEEFAKKDVQKTLLSLVVIYLFIAVFWSLYEQTGSSWVLQAKSEFINKHVDLRFWILNYDWLQFTLLPDQVQAVNPFLVLVMVPSFTLYMYPFINKFYTLTPLRKITIGMFITAISFLIVAWIEFNINKGIEMSILWQFLAYVILTIAEVMVYGTGLEFSYTQAPNSIKSLIMGIFLLSVSLGNLITALTNHIITREDGSSVLSGVDYYMFFVYMMLAAATLFIFVAYRYKEKTYIQE